MIRSGLAAAAMVALLAGGTQAHAETIEDYLVMDCNTFIGLPLETQVAVLFWLDGWRSRDDGHMQLAFRDISDAINAFETACADDPRVTLKQFLDFRL